MTNQLGVRPCCGQARVGPPPHVDLRFTKQSELLAFWIIMLGRIRCAATSILEKLIYLVVMVTEARIHVPLLPSSCDGMGAALSGID
jgi:hypothetical protein